MAVAAGKSDELRADMLHPLRPISFGQTAVTIDRRDDGTIYLRPKAQLRDYPYPVRITDRLHHWANETPDRIFMAERDTRAFSSEVDAGSHSNQVYADCVDLSAVENASKQKIRARS